jgi:hypothetical protein
MLVINSKAGGLNMKKSLANQICKLWNEQHVGSYEPTKTHAVVCKSAVENEYSVEVHPSGEMNDGHSFHSIEALANIEGALKVSAYITQDEEHKLFARIF